MAFGAPLRNGRVCIVSSRTGVAVDNVLVVPHQPNLSLLVFEPQAGPGYYEMYDGCIDDDESAQVAVAWRAVAARLAKQPPFERDGNLSSFWRTATVQRRVARKSIIFGVPWHHERPD